MFQPPEIKHSTILVPFNSLAFKSHLLNSNASVATRSLSSNLLMIYNSIIKKLHRVRSGFASLSHLVSIETSPLQLVPVRFRPIQLRHCSIQLCGLRSVGCGSFAETTPRSVRVRTDLKRYGRVWLEPIHNHLISMTLAGVTLCSDSDGIPSVWNEGWA